MSVAAPPTTRREATRARQFRRRRNRIALAGLGVAVLCLVGAGIVVAVIAHQVTAPAIGSAPQSVHLVYPEPAPGVDPVQFSSEPAGSTPPPPIAGQPLHLDIPSVGISLNVGSMGVPDDRSIDPPTPDSAYWLRDYSTVGPGAPGTAYIAGHTYSGGGTAAFNNLFDRSSRAIVLQPGATVQVTTSDAVYTYVVTGIADYPKPDVPDQGEIWANVPGRLVIVACQYNGDSSAVENTVVYTQLVTP